MENNNGRMDKRLVLLVLAFIAIILLMYAVLLMRVDVGISNSAPMIASAEQLAAVDRTQIDIKRTLKSCVHSACMKARARGNTERVGFLGFAGSGIVPLFGLINKLRAQSQRSSGSDIMLVYETHVPAYGYGKNHGWTKIVRAYREPIAHASSMLAESPSILEYLTAGSSEMQLSRLKAQVTVNKAFL